MPIDYLSKINKHNRDKYISFQEKGHIYNVNGDYTFTSTTTWIHSLFEKFDSDTIINNMMNSKNWNSSKYYGMTKNEIKQEWNKNKLIASSQGTKLHYDIECKYNNMDVSNDSIEYGYFLNFYNDYKHLIPYRTEMLIYHDELKLSGSVDMIFKRDDGNYEIYDWKRCRQILKTSNFNKWIKSDHVTHIPDSNFWHYALQLNTYKAILQEKYNINVVDLNLVVLHPDNKNYLHINIPDLQNEIFELFKERKNNLNI